MTDVYQVQIRSGTAAQVDSFTGAAGELTFDTDTGQLRVHDGVTAGGTKIPQAGSTGTFGALIADSLNKAAIGTTNANTGTFTVLTADSLDGAAIGSSNANTGNFTSLTATSLSLSSINGPSIGVSLANTGNFTSLTATSLSVPSINGPSIGDTLANTGNFTSLTATSLSVPSINGPSIGNSLANTGAFTVLTATSLSVSSIITAAQYDSTESLPDIKPSLNLDFANVKKLDPRITFTRGSTATYYDGKTFAKAEENLLLQSQDYSTTWTVTNLTPVTGKTAPDGTSTATEFTAGAGNAVLTQGYTALADDYTFSVWLRRVTGTGNIDIAADNGTWNTETISGTWARYEVTQTPAAGSKTAGIRVVTSGDAIEVWGAQLEQRSALTDYTATTTQPITNYIPALQTAASGDARFDHDPITGESKGFLIEEQRTNLLTYSEQFDNAAWTKGNTTISANAATAPDGQTTMDKLVEDSATSSHRTYVAVTATSNHTFSIYCKAAERSIISLELYNGTTALYVVANLSTGTLDGSSSGSATIRDLGDGIYRISVTHSLSGAGDSVAIYLHNAGGLPSAYTGDGYSGIYIWGAQLEAGSFPTSYIPTVASQVTRSPDAASMTGTNFSSWYRQDEGTIYVANQQATVDGSAGANYHAVAISDGTNNELIYIGTQYGSSNLEAATVDGGVGQFTVTAVAPSGGEYRRSLTYTADDFGYSINGGAATTDASGTLPTVSRMYIGSNNGASYLGGTISRLVYYPKRLSNATLQALTEE
jgi:hypothetical protein